jgi:hypothetical protein
MPWPYWHCPREGQADGIHSIYINRHGNRERAPGLLVNNVLAGSDA